MSRGSSGENKFILYQILYIVILTIMVYKGAELTLSKVAESNVPEVASKLISNKYQNEYKKERDINKKLNARNVDLLNQITDLRNQVAELKRNVGGPLTPMVSHPEDNPPSHEIDQLISMNSVIANPVKKIYNNAINYISNPTNVDLYFCTSRDEKNLLSQKVIKKGGKNIPLDLTKGVRKSNKSKNPQLYVKYFNPDNNQPQLFDAVEIFDKEAIPDPIFDARFGAVSTISRLQGSTWFNVKINYSFPEDLEIKIINPSAASDWVYFEEGKFTRTNKDVVNGKADVTMKEFLVNFKGNISEKEYENFVDWCSVNGMDKERGYRFNVNIIIRDKHSNQEKSIRRLIDIQGY